MKRSIPVWLRCGIIVLPSMIVIMIGLDPTATLVLSQVCLSFGMPFVVIPLIMFPSDRKLMGAFASKRPVVFAAVIIAAIIMALNLYLIIQALLPEVLACNGFSSRLTVLLSVPLHYTRRVWAEPFSSRRLMADSVSVPSGTAARRPA
ncbi:MAG: hypothetical protein E4H20_06460 [Spirochaetales bacterium]|nr:MAG: hypothetical protein E4H20_06460 [Spirochaetales bacterium]